MPDQITNNLSGQKSPYLLQHASNPVYWYPWGNQALTKAREEDKLIVISIGYAACHWCHVMEKESFSDDAVARRMNENFISIKVDREERPDIDTLYMSACQLMTSKGGWPLNVIALPDQRPVFAGTYFRKDDWIRILEHFAEAYSREKNRLMEMSQEIIAELERSMHPDLNTGQFNMAPEQLALILDRWKRHLDFSHGGHAGFPKFPLPVNLQTLSDLSLQRNDQEVSGFIRLTLDAMAGGGIFDQLGGGFYRYSVDGNWHIPHFEKMLYDNAQLISLYAGAYRLYRHDLYRKIMMDSLDFTERELETSCGLCYASIDADSRGVEGDHYTWTMQEVITLFPEYYLIVCDYFGITGDGNWEDGKNVLRIAATLQQLSAKYHLTEEELATLINTARKEMFMQRSVRERPVTDTKILTSWNGLMISAWVDAYKALKHDGYLKKAERAAQTYMQAVTGRDMLLWRNYHSGEFLVKPFLEDYAWFIKSLTDLYQVTFDSGFLKTAMNLTDTVMIRFADSRTGLFYLSLREENSLIVAPIEITDNVIPSANSQMARNLFTLGYLAGRQDYISKAEEMLVKMSGHVIRYPWHYANWIALMADVINPPAIVKISGPDSRTWLKEIVSGPYSHVLWSGDTESTAVTTAIVCRDKSCSAPVDSLAQLIGLLM